MRKRRGQGGFSLIELTLVLGLSVMLATAVIGMFNTNLQMTNQAVQYQFLAKDAPFIGLLLTKTIGNAEDYRIFATRNNAVASTAAVFTGPAVRLLKAQPSGAFRQAILSFETIGGPPGHFFFLGPRTNRTRPRAPSQGMSPGQVTD